MSLWYLGTGTGPILGALTAYGLLFYTGDHFRSWQIVFLIYGLITIAVGICVVIFLPDSPMAAPRLSREEKIVCIERVRENQTGIENKRFKMSQFIEIWQDPQTYLIIIIVTAMNVNNAATSTFSSQIIKNFGYTTKETELLNIPGGVISLIAVYSAGYLSSRFDQRCWSAVLVLAIGLVGSCLQAFCPGNQGAQLAGNYLTNTIGASLPVLYSIGGANTAGHTKKVTMNAVLLMSFCLGNILGPLTFREGAPQFMAAKETMVGTLAVTIAFTLVLKYYYIWENRRRDLRKQQVMEADDSGVDSEDRVQDKEFLDLTDRKNMAFRVSFLFLFFLTLWTDLSDFF